MCKSYLRHRKDRADHAVATRYAKASASWSAGRPLRRADPHHHQGDATIRTIVTVGLLVAVVLYLYWLGAFDLPISIARWWIGGHGRR